MLLARIWTLFPRILLLLFLSKSAQSLPCSRKFLQLWLIWRTRSKKLCARLDLDQHEISTCYKSNDGKIITSRSKRKNTRRRGRSQLYHSQSNRWKINRGDRILLKGLNRVWQFFTITSQGLDKESQDLESKNRSCLAKSLGLIRANH